MKLRCTLVLILFYNLSFSQKQKSVLIHTNAQSHNYFNDKKINSFDIGFLSASYQIQKKKYHWSYELAKLHFNREEIGHTYIANQQGKRMPYPQLMVKTFQVAARIVCSKKVITKGKSVFYFGGAVQGLLAARNSIPFTSNNYPTSARTVGVTAQGQVGYQYNLNKRVFLDAQALVPLFNLNYQRKKLLDATLAYNEQKIDVINLEILQHDYYLRLGVGFYL